MAIKHELKKLKQIDIWSIMLFVLYKFQNISEYSTMSELAYVLDQKNFLRLCEYFGGQIIKIPTLDELEDTIYAMLLYQYIDVEHIPEPDALNMIPVQGEQLKNIKSCYRTLRNVLSEYTFSCRGAL